MLLPCVGGGLLLTGDSGRGRLTLWHAWPCEAVAPVTHQDLPDNPRGSVSSLSRQG
ncbi:MAG: hypothetical protein K2O88_00365 [Paramuribaculum sp.]|nr:hypothetical protein [Paramuribaculum sp.]